jgi:hypothetical protein
MSTILRAALLALALPMSACGMVSPHSSEPAEAPPMRWDFRPEAPAWTAATLSALESDGAALAEIVPADIDTFCPSYVDSDPRDRRAFWAGLFSALAKHESTWNPAASGGGGRWIGLLQISPRTAQQYGCDASSVAELKDGAANLACGVRIAAVQVGRDGLVAGNGSQGIGRDWAPIRSADKRDDIAEWTRAQSYCTSQ